MERALCCAGSIPQVFHKSSDSAAPAFCAFPARAAQAARSLTGALSPGAARLLPSAVPASVSTCTSRVPALSLLASPAPVPTHASRVPTPCVSLQPSRRMSTIQNLRRSLIRNWRPVCSAVGDAVLGAEPAPFPSPLPPAPSGAGLVRSLQALLWTCSDPCSVNGRQCVQAG